MGNKKIKIELLCVDEEFKAQYDAILEKHSATKDREAAMAEISELAATKGVTLDKANLYEVDAKGKTELSEESLEEISGGGSGLALCMFEIMWDTGKQKGLYGDGPFVRKCDDGTYETYCESHYKTLCSWLGCRCYKTNHCDGTWHKCNEDGSPIRFHAVTS